MSKQKTSDTFKKVIGEKIKSIREKNSETQSKLARKIGLKQNSISKAECGKNSLSIPNLIKLCEHYNISLDYLCRGIESNSTIDNLNRYVDIKYSTIFFDAEYSFPQIEIEKEYFRYLFESANVSRIKNMPDGIKDNWLNEIKNRFQKHSYEKPTDSVSSSADSDSFIIIPQELLFKVDNHSDILRDVQKHFSELNME